MILSYNGITLKLLKLHEYTQQPVRSGDSADWICDRVSLDVSAVYSPAATSYGPGPAATPGRLPAQTAAAIHHALMSPRGRLTYSDEAGNVVLSSPPAGNSRDAIDGPNPIRVTVREIVGIKAWFVRFSVETFLNTCPGGGSGSPLLSNRFGQTHEIDAEQLTTVVTQGESWFQMDALEDAGTTADFYRRLVVPPEPAGFRRVAMKVNVSSLGNKLTWQAVDRQQLRQMQIGDGLDVLTFRANYTQQSIRPDGALAPSGRVTHIVSAQVLGKPQAARANLFVFAMKLALVKMPLLNNPNPAADLFLADISANESLDANAVEVRVVAQGPAAQQGVAGAGGLRAGFFLADGVAYQFEAPWLDPNGLAPSLGADRNTRTPTLLALAFAAEIQAPCSSPSPAKGPPGPGGGDPTYDVGPSYSIGVTVGDTSGELEQASTLWSSENSDGGVYTEYRIDNAYRTDEGLYVAPIAGPVSGSTQFGHTDDNGNWVPDAPGTKSVEVMRLGLPATYMTSEITAERQSSPPALPTPDPSDPNYRLLEWDQQPASVGLMTDGVTPVFRASARYEYVLLSPARPGEPLPFPVTPNTAIAFGDAVAGDFRPGLIMGDTGSGAGEIVGGIGGGALGGVPDGISGNS